MPESKSKGRDDDKFRNCSASSLIADVLDLISWQSHEQTRRLRTDEDLAPCAEKVATAHRVYETMHKVAE